MPYHSEQSSNILRLLRTFCGLLAVAVVLFVGIPLWSTTTLGLSSYIAVLPTPPPETVQGKRLIILEHADQLRHNQELHPDIVILIGSVRLRHGNWVMTCDSANLNELTNSFEAFGHVDIQEGDSISITAGQMEYDGMSTMAVLHDNVILTKDLTTLFTEELFYDRSQKVAYYENFGTLADTVNTLTSTYGEYNTDSGEALFQDQVHLDNANFTLDTDILHYNSETAICRIVSPTLIETTDSITIETDRGFYNTDTEQSILLDRSLITHPDGTMTGDSILYDKQRQISQAYYDVEIDNQTDKVTYYGDYGYMDESNGYVYATGRAYIVDYSEADTLYMSADIMEGVKSYIASSEDATDSIEVKYTKGYHNVRLYRTDIQAIGDSIHHFSVDSLIKLFGNPILWNDSTQLKGDTIYAHLANDTIDYALAWPHGSTVRWLEEKKQDRVKADTIEAYFRQGTLDHAFYRSNVESRYYLLQENTKHYYALAQVQNPQMDVYIADNKLDRIFWHGKAEGTIHPIEEVTDALRYMSGAEWFGDKRPSSPDDVIPDRITQPPLDRDSLPSLMDQDSVARAEFDGLVAWQAFYQEYQQAIQQRSDRETATDSVEIVAPTDSLGDLSISADQLSIYIARPVVDDTTSAISAEDTWQRYLHLMPQYLWASYLDLDSPANSTTVPYIGIPGRSDYSDASSNSDESSKPPTVPLRQTTPVPAPSETTPQPKSAEE